MIVFGILRLLLFLTFPIYGEPVRYRYICSFITDVTTTLRVDLRTFFYDLREDLVGATTRTFV